MPLIVCDMPLHAWQATKPLKNDGLFCDLPVSILLLWQYEQNDDITIPCYNDMNACMPAMKAINYPCMHVLLSL